MRKDEGQTNPLFLQRSIERRDDFFKAAEGNLCECRSGVIEALLTPSPPLHTTPLHPTPTRLSPDCLPETKTPSEETSPLKGQMVSVQSPLTSSALALCGRAARAL